MKNKVNLVLISSLVGLSFISCARTNHNVASSGNVNVIESNNINSNVTSINDSTSEKESFNEEISLDFPSPSQNPSRDYDETLETSINLSNGIVSNDNGYVVKEENTIYILKGGLYELVGSTTSLNVIVNVSDEEKVEIGLNGTSITSSSTCPLLIYNANKCEISAKKGTYNLIKDERKEGVDYPYNSALYATCDLELKGKGSLEVISNSNNGIHSKDDIEIKNLTLKVTAVDNAIKGNDSLTITSGNIEAISTKGDSLKTKNTGISPKGKQKGTISLLGGNINLYAACDALDASYNVVIEEGVVLNCYTDSYSEYSLEVTDKETSIANKKMYISYSSTIASYTFKAIFYLSDGTSKNVTAQRVQGGTSKAYYSSLDVPSNAVSIVVEAYNGTNKVFETERQNLNDTKDCLAIKYSSSSVSTSWTNYQVSSRPGGPGGPQEGNPNKSDYSCKGIKADNEIIVNGGTIFIKSHDDAIHTNSGDSFENGEIGLGNISINGGNLILYSDDDGIHADYKLNINGGNINITHSYEGIEGNIISFNGGVTKLVSSDDGINATQNKEGVLLKINGGVLYVDANGDGIDSNGDIKMTGGYVVATGPTNGGNGVLDYDKSFTATGGYLLAVGCSGMNQGVSASSNAKSGTKSISTTNGSYVSLVVDGTTMLALKITKSNQNYCAYSYVGSNGSVSVSSSTTLDFGNELYYVNML